jgi:hypothetical protein
MILSNDQKTQFVTHVCASDLTTIQLKFIFYLYRITVDCQMLSAPLRSLSRVANGLNLDVYNFTHDVADLVERDIVVKVGRLYGINFDYDIWALDRQSKNKDIPKAKPKRSDRISSVNRVLNIDIHESLENLRCKKIGNIYQFVWLILPILCLYYW